VSVRKLMAVILARVSCAKNFPFSILLNKGARDFGEYCLGEFQFSKDLP